eukprot:GEMP01039362.1.p1 GENE.GEMP01039362.1~~GEMP01039362.1.p1  ORF type:complete len:235 (+),score=39.67 GEMP01039362.1:25-705(+)
MHWETVLDDTGVGRVRVLHGFLSPQEAIWYFKHFAGSDYRVIRPGNPSLGEFEVDGVTFNRKCPRGTMHRGQKMCMEHGGVPGYGFSGITVETQTMAEEEVNLLKRMNEATSTDANALLLNYYRSDIIDLEQDPPKRYVDSLGAHSDNEKELLGGFVVGIAFMERESDTRLLRFRHKLTKERKDVWMKAGTLYIMEGPGFQRNWTHEVPKTKHKPAIISATARKFR